MDVEFVKIVVPSYLGSNVMECPIQYCLRKYNYDVLFPKSYRSEKNTYMVCFPSIKTVECIRLLEDHEDCKITWMKTHRTLTDDLTNTYVTKTGDEYIVTKAI
jgi:hypothetical protein